MAVRANGARRNGPAANAQPAIAHAAADVEASLNALVGDIADLDLGGIRLRWRNHVGGGFPAHMPNWLLARLLAYRIQAAARGDLDAAVRRRICRSSSDAAPGSPSPFRPRIAATREGIELRPGALLVREWKGRMERVMILDEGFAWNGTTYSSLSQVAQAITGVHWNGHRFFGLRKAYGSRFSEAADAQ
jgi:DUF2924 family protein